MRSRLGSQKRLGGLTLLLATIWLFALALPARGQVAQNWIAAGTPRPTDPAARPDDVLAGVVIDAYRPATFQQFVKFCVSRDGRARSQDIVRNKPIPIDECYKWHGLLKINVEMRCVFEMSVDGQVKFIVDNEVMTRVRVPNEPDLYQPRILKPGYHEFSVELSQFVMNFDKTTVDLMWSVNGGRVTQVYPDAFFHYRRQESYADAAVAPRPPQPPAPPAPIARLPIPEPLALARLAVELRKRYPADFVAPPTAAQVRQLLNDAAQNRNDSVAYYALLQEAAKRGQALGDTALVFEAIDATARQFLADPFRLKLDAIRQLPAPRLAEMQTMTALATLSDEAMEQRNYAAANDIADFFLLLAKNSAKADQIAAADERVRKAAAGKAAFGDFKDAQARVARNPADAEANRLLGNNYCFLLKSWERGIPLLARGDDPVLAWLGQHELAPLETLPEQLAVAHGWWDAADGRIGPVADAARERACQWYRRLLPRVQGMSQRVLAARLAEIATAPQATPDFFAPTVAAIPIMPEKTRDKLAAPFGLTLARAEKRVATAYSKELTDTSLAGQEKLKLLLGSEMFSTRDDPDGRYVLMIKDRELRKTMGDAAGAAAIQRTIDKSFNPPTVADANSTAPGAMPGPAAANKARPIFPVPPEAAQLDIRKKLKARYFKAYTDFTPAARAALVAQLVADANASSDALEVYATLREAAEVAACAGDFAASQDCIASITRISMADEMDLRTAALTAAAHFGKNAPPPAAIVSAAMTLAQDATSRGNYDAAQKAMLLANGALAAAKDESLNASVKLRERDLREVREHAQRLAPTFQKLAANPDAPELNATIGRFFCMTVGNWRKGLPLLAKGSDVPLQVLAQAELSGPIDMEAILKVADGWWDKSATETGMSASHCKDHAGSLYRQAVLSARGPAPERAIARATVTFGKTVDLFATMNLKVDTRSGEWTFHFNELKCFDQRVCVIRFPHRVPEEYNYTVEFTVVHNPIEVVQIIPSKFGLFAFCMRRSSATFDPANPQSTTHPIPHPFKLEEGRYTSVFEVRRTGMRVFINGKLAGEWQTDYSGTQDGVLWWRPDGSAAPNLGFASNNTFVTVHSARLVEVLP